MRSNELLDKIENAHDVAKNKPERRPISVKTLPRPPEHWLNPKIKPEASKTPGLPVAKQADEQVLHFLNQNQKQLRNRDSYAFKSVGQKMSNKSNDEPAIDLL